MTVLNKYILTFLMSMVPVIELRGAVPFGVGMDLPLLPVLIVSVVGNMLPVPFIALFIRRIFGFLRRRSLRLDALVTKIEDRARKKARKIKKYETLGLFILVAIPLPGTGAWTGALVGALLNIRLKWLLPAVFAGVVTAGVIMSVLTYGAGALIGLV
jgi:uncharacterized membrane protein